MIMIMFDDSMSISSSSARTHTSPSVALHRFVFELLLLLSYSIYEL